MSEEPVELADMKPRRYIKKVPRRLKPFQLLYQTDEDEDKYSITLPKGINKFYRPQLLRSTCTDPKFVCFHLKGYFWRLFSKYLLHMDFFQMYTAT